MKTYQFKKKEWLSFAKRYHEVTLSTMAESLEKAVENFYTTLSYNMSRKEIKEAIQNGK